MILVLSVAAFKLLLAFIAMSAMSISTTISSEEVGINDMHAAHRIKSDVATASSFADIRFDVSNTVHGYLEFIVPVGVTYVKVAAFGAAGGNRGSNAGGFGASCEVLLTVTPGMTLYVFVGSQPSAAAILLGGFNGGGDGDNVGSGGGGGRVSFIHLFVLYLLVNNLK